MAIIIFGYNIKRLLVICTSIIIIALTATDLSNGVNDMTSKIIDYIVLFIAVAGFVGALQNNIKYLQWFLILLAILTITKIGWIIYAAFHAGEAATGWDIGVAVLLGVATIQTADIIRAPHLGGYEPLEDSLLP